MDGAERVLPRPVVSNVPAVGNQNVGEGDAGTNVATDLAD